MRNFKARISKLEKNIKNRKKLYKIYWADGKFISEYQARLYDVEVQFLHYHKFVITID